LFWSITDPIQDPTFQVDRFGARPNVGLVFDVVLTVAYYLARVIYSSVLVEPNLESGMWGGAK
jgi:hypothetical protein